jgi:hypothetical protein
MSQAFLDLSGQVFGRLTVLARAANRGRATAWHCRCTCGTTTIVRAGHLRSGNTRSCGCWKRAAIATGLHRTHGHARHGAHTPEYYCWRAMRERCDSPKASSFTYYGGRGITVCVRWRESFEAFLADMGPRPSPQHSIDRLDNDGNYEPGNCRWATRSEQRRNRRTGRTRLDGTPITLTAMAAELAIPRHFLAARLQQKAGSNV